MSKGLTQGSAWALSIIFSILLFAGIVALIMNIKVTRSDYDYGKEGDMELKSDSNYRSPSDGENKEIRVGDQSFEEPHDQQKKSLYGPIKEIRVLNTGRV